MSDIETMIGHAANQDFNAANDVFQELIGQRMTDALDQAKIEVAGQVFNGEEEQLELDLEDEDFESDDEEEETDFESDDDDEEEETNVEEDFQKIQDMNQEGKIQAEMKRLGYSDDDTTFTDVADTPNELDLESMTKKQLEDLGRDHGVELDRRKSKTTLLKTMKGILSKQYKLIWGTYEII